MNLSKFASQLNTRSSRRSNQIKVQYGRLEDRRLLAIDVSGPITTNTVWDAAEGYLLVGDVTVSESATLTVSSTVSTSNTEFDLIIEDGSLSADMASFLGSENELVVRSGSSLSLLNSTTFSGDKITFEEGSSGQVSDSTISSGRLDVLSSQVAVDDSSFSGTSRIRTNPMFLDGIFADNELADGFRFELTGTITEDVTLDVATGIDSYLIAGDLEVAVGSTLRLSPGVKILDSTTDVLYEAPVEEKLYASIAESNGSTSAPAYIATVDVDSLETKILFQTPRTPLDGNRVPGDLVVDESGDIFLYNGFFDAHLLTYDASVGTYTQSTFPGWSTTRGSTGGIDRLGDSIFLTDMETKGDGDLPQGILKYDIPSETYIRFAETITPQDLAIGFDGLIYALPGNSTPNDQVSIYDPVTLELVRQVTLEVRADHRSIGALADGTFFTAAWDGVVRHFDVDGAVINSKSYAPSSFFEIEISADGKVALGNRSSELILTTTDLGDDFQRGALAASGSGDLFLDWANVKQDSRIVVEGTMVSESVHWERGSAQIRIATGGNLEMYNSYYSGSQIYLDDGSTGQIVASTLDADSGEGVLSIAGSSTVAFEANSIYYDNVRTFGFGPNDIDLSGTYWGTTDAVEIEARIFHQVDENFYPLVDFSDVLSEPTNLAVIRATPGDDVVSVDATTMSAPDIVINGSPYTLLESLGFTDFRIDGLGGADEVTVDLGATDEAVELTPGESTISGEANTILLDAFENITVNSGGGDDVLTLHDSAGEDVLEASELSAEMKGDGYRHRGNQFANVTGLAGNGDNDRATLNLESAGSYFVHRDGRSVVRGGTSNLNAAGFPLVNVNGVADGSSRGTFWGDETDNQFFRDQNEAQFHTTDIVVVARNFAGFSVKGNGGYDTANIQDTPLDDELVANEDIVYFSNANGTFASLENFEQLTVRSTQGEDSATLTGSSDSETLNATSDYTHLVRPVGFVFAVGFSRTNTNGLGGVDEAYLSSTTSEASRFVGGPTSSRMFNDKYFVNAKDFDDVFANSNTADDVAFLNGSTGDDSLYSTPVFVGMTTPLGTLNATNFRELYAISGGGSDHVTMRDSEDDDLFVIRPNSALFQSGDITRFAIGFSDYNAIATLGNDVARFFDSAGADRLFKNDFGTTLNNEDFRIHGSGFDSVFVTSVGGEDEAYLDDTEANDILFAASQDVGMYDEENTYSWRASGFETVLAFSNNGGIDQAFENEFENSLELVGDWE